MKTVVLLLLLLLLLLSMLLLLLLLLSSSSFWFKISCQRDSAASSSNKCVYRICPNTFPNHLRQTAFLQNLQCYALNLLKTKIISFAVTVSWLSVTYFEVCTWIFCHSDSQKFMQSHFCWELSYRFQSN